MLLTQSYTSGNWGSFMWLHLHILDWFICHLRTPTGMYHNTFNWFAHIVFWFHSYTYYFFLHGSSLVGTHRWFTVHPLDTSYFLILHSFIHLHAFFTIFLQNYKCTHTTHRDCGDLACPVAVSLGLVGVSRINPVPDICLRPPLFPI